MLCSPHQGTVVYAEDMADRRYSFYAPQVWMRQRRILMPTSSILGTHMKNNYEVLLLNTEIDEGAFSPPSTNLVDWADTPGVHQRMWDNEMGAGSAVINHALPTDRLEDKAALFEAWGIR